MSQSLVKNYVHFITSTKNRLPLIQPEFENKLHEYIGGICNNLECYPLKIGGYTNHIHILLRLSQKIALMKFVEEIKSHSSKWVKRIDPSLNNFYWQDGYGAFSVHPAEVDRLIQYIANQHEHHKHQGFKSEYRLILKKYQVEYDEKFVWD